MRVGAAESGLRVHIRSISVFVVRYILCECGLRNRFFGISILCALRFRANMFLYSRVEIDVLFLSKEHYCYEMSNKRSIVKNMYFFPIRSEFSLDVLC